MAKIYPALEDLEEMSISWRSKHEQKAIEFNLDPKGLKDWLMGFWTKKCRQGDCDFGLEWWHPEDYLDTLPAPRSWESARTASEGQFDPDSLRWLREKISHEQRMDPLFLDVTSCNITKKGETRDCMEHEGRHRAYVARELGIEWVPVVVIREKGHSSAIKPCYVRRPVKEIAED